jgi:hypothetical protein
MPKPWLLLIALAALDGDFPYQENPARPNLMPCPAFSPTSSLTRQKAI